MDFPQFIDGKLQLKAVGKQSSDLNPGAIDPPNHALSRAIQSAATFLYE